MVRQGQFEIGTADVDHEQTLDATSDKSAWAA
jgi:hypothetical protein